MQKKYTAMFTKKSSSDIQYMVNQLEGSILIPREEGAQFREYGITLSGGIEYPIQMLLVNETGKKIWKIRGI